MTFRDREDKTMSEGWGDVTSGHNGITIGIIVRCFTSSSPPYIKCSGSISSGPAALCMGRDSTTSATSSSVKITSFSGGWARSWDLAGQMT